MYKLKKVHFSLAIVVLLALFATGCLKGISDIGGTSSYNVTGTVREAGTGVPLSGAKVEMSTKSATTNASGQYSLTNVPEGTRTLKVTLDGYRTDEQSVNLTQNKTVNVYLGTDAPTFNMGVLRLSSGATGTEVEDGGSIEDTTITLRFNVFDLLPTQVAGLNALNATDGIVAYAIVNGTITHLDIGYYGDVNQQVPVHPGQNFIQLRIRTASGYSRTSPIITITVNIPRLDIRTILEWDTDHTDVDLHLFKRSESEGNIFSWTYDRHVYYFNKRPGDFGEGNENPFLDVDDVDGYGPETIVVKEATAGDYHIWVHPYRLGYVPMTIASVKVILDGGRTNAREKIFEIELPSELDGGGLSSIPKYVTTVRVSRTGAKSFVYVNPSVEDYFMSLDANTAK